MKFQHLVFEISVQKSRQTHKYVHCITMFVLLLGHRGIVLLVFVGEYVFKFLNLGLSVFFYTGVILLCICGQIMFNLLHKL